MQIVPKSLVLAHMVMVKITKFQKQYLPAKKALTNSADPDQTASLFAILTSILLIPTLITNFLLRTEKEKCSKFRTFILPVKMFHEWIEEVTSNRSKLVQDWLRFRLCSPFTKSSCFTLNTFLYNIFPVLGLFLICANLLYFAAGHCG